MTGLARQTRVRQYGLDPGAEDIINRSGLGDLSPGNQLDMGPEAEQRRAADKARNEQQDRQYDIDQATAASAAASAATAATAASESAAATAADQERLKRAGRGRASTVLTGALGDSGFTTSARRTLLGA